MNQKIRSLLAVAVATAFPLAVVAQSGTSGSSTGSGSTGSSTSGSSSNTSGARTGTSGGSTSGSSAGQSASGAHGSSSSMSAGHSASGSMSGAGISSFQRISRDRIEQQLTAKTLIGKDVHDNQGEKIGTIENVVLDTSAAPQLAAAFSSQQRDKNDNAMGATSTAGRTQASTTPGATGSTYAGTSDGRTTTSSSGAGASGSATAGSTRSSTGGTSTGGTSGAGAMGAASMHGAMSAMSGPAVVISAGGLFSRNELVRVPLSQLNYDASNERITLNVSREQFSAVTESDTGRNAAE